MQPKLIVSGAVRDDLIVLVRQQAREVPVDLQSQEARKVPVAPKVREALEWLRPERNSH